MLALQGALLSRPGYFTTLDDLVKNLAVAILDRLLHHSHVISIRGHSYRLRDKLTQAAATPLLPTTLEPAGPTAKGGKNQS